MPSCFPLGFPMFGVEWRHPLFSSSSRVIPNISASAPITINLITKKSCTFSTSTRLNNRIYGGTSKVFQLRESERRLCYRQCIWRRTLLWQRWSLTSSPLKSVPASSKGRRAVRASRRGRTDAFAVTAYLHPVLFSGMLLELMLNVRWCQGQVCLLKWV